MKSVVASAIGVLACIGVFLTLAAAPPRIKINIPAANMKATVTQFRDQFEKDYLAPRQPFPLFSMMYRAGIHPLDIDDEIRIGKGSDGKARTAIFSSDGSAMTSNGVDAKGVTFQMLLQGKVSNVLVDCPGHLSARVTTESIGSENNRLQFSFDQPLKFHVDPASLGLPVPGDLYLRSISLSDTALDYQFSTSPASAAATAFELNLDLTKSNTGQ